MSKIEVIKKTVQQVGDINHEYGSLLVGKTECGSFAWSIEAATFEKWEIIPESLYLELMKFVDSMPAKVGDKVKLNELGVKEVLSEDWIDCETLDKLQAETSGIIKDISPSINLFTVEFGDLVFYLNPEMVDKIVGGDYCGH